MLLAPILLTGWLVFIITTMRSALVGILWFLLILYIALFLSLIPNPWGGNAEFLWFLLPNFLIFVRWLRSHIQRRRLAHPPTTI